MIKRKLVVYAKGKKSFYEDIYGRDCIYVNISKDKNINTIRGMRFNDILVHDSVNCDPELLNHLLIHKCDRGRLSSVGDSYTFGLDGENIIKAIKL